jgi:hypothetical protein
VLSVALALLLPAAHAAGLDPAARARLSALKNEGEGALVSEQALRRRERRTPEAAARKQALKDAAYRAAPFLDQSVRRYPRNDTGTGLEGKNCFDAAPKLAMMLRAQGWPVYSAHAAGHVFLIADFPEGSFIVDPTIRQFLGEGRVSWVPLIFVGTVSELAALYARDPGLPVLPYRKIYFDAEWPAYRKDSAMLGKRDALLRSPDGAEYGPIASYFNTEAGRARASALPLPLTPSF